MGWDRWVVGTSNQEPGGLETGECQSGDRESERRETETEGRAARATATRERLSDHSTRSSLVATIRVSRQLAARVADVCRCL